MRKQSELRIGFDAVTRMSSEFCSLRVAVGRKCRQLFSPRDLRRVISGPRARWRQDAIALCLEHRVPVVFVDEYEQVQGMLEPWQPRHCSLDRRVASMLAQPDGPVRLQDWYRHWRHQLALGYLRDWGKQDEGFEAENVLERMQQVFLKRCVPDCSEREKLVDRFDLELDLLAIGLTGNGRLKLSRATGGRQGIGLAHCFSTLFQLQGRRQLLRKRIRLPGQDALLPDFVARHLRDRLFGFNGCLQSSLAGLVP